MSNVKKPMPVAAMWMDSSGGRMLPTTKFAVWPPFEPIVELDALVTTEQSEAYANERVREALEEAASLVDARRSNGLSTDLRSVAAGIRALIPNMESKT